MGSNTDMNEEVKNEITDKEILTDYLVSLIIGVVLLFVMWKVVVVLASGLPQIYRYAIGISAAIALFVTVMRDRNMITENKIKLMGSIIITILAIFWSAVISVEPNFLLRIMLFISGFGTSSLVLTLPLVWLARSIDSQISGRSAT